MSTSSIYRLARHQVGWPLIPAYAVCLLGLMAGLKVSSHESTAIICRDYLCCMILFLIPAVLYNLYILRLIRDECEHIEAYNRQMDEITHWRPRRSSMDLAHERLDPK